MALARITLLVILPSLLSSASVGDNNDVHHGRIIDNKLSEKRHFGDEHDADYDHEAFLGTNEAHEFDSLTPEESRSRLGKIVDQIDIDQDGYVTFDEMKDWLMFTHQRYISADVDGQWSNYKADGKEAIEWNDYRKTIYGFVDEDHEDGEMNQEDALMYKKMEARDHRRWQVADEDNNGELNKLEFRNYLHPEEVAHMQDIVIQETVDDIDKDGDGKISLEEYIGDIFRSGSDADDEPDWVRTERETFKEHRDNDGDGFMDNDEIRKWIMPPQYDHLEAEANHLVSESDADGDQKLTKDEILEKYDLFVGSQATDYGEALNRHDEF